jgi:hypothetical protein
MVKSGPLLFPSPLARIASVSENSGFSYLFEICNALLWMNSFLKGFFFFDGDHEGSKVPQFLFWQYLGLNSGFALAKHSVT